jgi:hypothetical protein
MRAYPVVFTPYNERIAARKILGKKAARRVGFQGTRGAAVSILMETALKAAQNGIMSFANTAGRAVLGTMTWRTAGAGFWGDPLTKNGT